jgi:hypothetical protein
MAYIGLVASRALTETKSFWSLHRTVAFFLVPLSAVLLRALLTGIKVSGWHEIALFTVFGFVVAWIGTYLINFIRVPAILHGELVRENAGLRAIAYPPREEKSRGVVREMLKDFSTDERAVLQFILERGRVTSHVIQGSGVDPKAISGAMRKGIDCGLLEKESDAPPFTPAMSVAEHFARIARVITTVYGCVPNPVEKLIAHFS